MSKLITNQTNAWESVMAETFIEMLEAQWAKGKHLCIGLDPDHKKLPDKHKIRAAEMKFLLVDVVRRTKDVAACYKPNSAFFESSGWQGVKQLEELMEFIRKEAPGVPVILDAKRGDIGNTNVHYARMAFDVMGADALTIHPIFGWEANKSFLDRADKGIIVLCRTSNQGSGEFQDLVIRESKEDRVRRLNDDTWNTLFGDSPDALYQHIALNVSNPETWNKNGNCCLVTGGTYPGEIAKIRQIARDIPLLIPGIGSQGGDLKASVVAAEHRFLISSSSGIIFADDPKHEAELLHHQIQEALAMVARA